MLLMLFVFLILIFLRLFVLFVSFLQLTFAVFINLHFNLKLVLNQVFLHLFHRLALSLILDQYFSKKLTADAYLFEIINLFYGKLINGLCNSRYGTGVQQI